MKLDAMAVTLPEVSGHPNRSPFTGVLTLVDEPSTKPPSGARGHRVILTRGAALAALPSLLGMAVDYAPSWDGHDARRKCGIITNADVQGPRLLVAGYLFAKDFPEVERQMRQCLPGAMGMSWELADAHVEDMRAEVWTLTQATFTGAAILLREKAAYRNTSFELAAARCRSIITRPTAAQGVHAGATKQATGRLRDGAGVAFPKRETGKESTWSYRQPKTWSL
ncbi:MAG TPA: hypothetical protein VHZ25_10855 [Acidobacteriaceae bacterium]|jgi:hypothetical protein|nr:hypothetical protein [Acidobacteriaceae bacterium]